MYVSEKQYTHLHIRWNKQSCTCRNMNLHLMFLPSIECFLYYYYSYFYSVNSYIFVYYKYISNSFCFIKFFFFFWLQNGKYRKKSLSFIIQKEIKNTKKKTRLHTKTLITDFNFLILYSI